MLIVARTAERNPRDGAPFPDLIKAVHAGRRASMTCFDNGRDCKAPRRNGWYPANNRRNPRNTDRTLQSRDDAGGSFFGIATTSLSDSPSGR